MLTDIVESGLAVGVCPEPALAAVEAGASLAASGRVPEGDGDVISVHPLPVGRVLRVANCADPVLAAAVAPAQKKGWFEDG